ncbi:uncharacterized protein LOC134540268 [Bacillus rossius redtenbacheri]|uniref:uncharacterized protein LOC134540268 n=1 Tax=Bacillus rossius redtenbacheri TaxID=93214 RepID=UPI002FDEFB96
MVCPWLAVVALLTACSVQVSTAATFAYSQEEKPERLGQCYHGGNTSLLLGNGDAWHPPGACERLVCVSGPRPGRMTLLHFTCDAAEPGTGCVLRPGNHRLRFPYCCDTAECPED